MTHRRTFTSIALLSAMMALIIAPVVPALGQTATTYSVVVNDPSVNEGDTGTTPMTFTVGTDPVLSGSDCVEIDYTLSDGTPNEDDWFPSNEAFTGTLLLNSGTPQETVAVDVSGDTEVEGDETLLLTLILNDASCTADVNSPLPSATGTILNDDSAPVGNQPPVAQDDFITTTVDTPVEFNVLDNDEDPDGDLLSITDTTGGPDLGTLQPLGGGNYRYTPAPGDVGSDGSFTYFVSDGTDGSQATVSFEITEAPVNSAPVAGDDVIKVRPGTTKTFNVLDNDFDPDFDTLELLSSTTPGAGSVICTADGSCTYTPHVEATDGDSTTFDYTIQDPSEAQDTGTVTINIFECPAIGSALDPNGLVVSESWSECSDPDAVGRTGALGVPWPMAPTGTDMAVMTSGDAALLNQANSSGSEGATHETEARGANDVSILKLDLEVPGNTDCLSFDFVFGSEEYPEFVNSSFNDGFIAELDSSTWSVSGSNISAPNNFAFDTEGSIVSVNSPFFSTTNVVAPTGTEYDGSTPLLTARTPVTPGSHSLYLSIFDAGDFIYDSGITVDNLQAYDAPPETCIAGATLTTDPPGPELPVLTVSSAQITEGNEGTQNLVFDFTVDPVPTDFSSVQFTTQNGTATSGEDFEATSGTLLLSSGPPISGDVACFQCDFLVEPTTSTAEISVPIVGDTVFEPDETFTIELSQASGIDLASTSVVGTILNDDASPDPVLLPPVDLPLPPVDPPLPPVDPPVDPPLPPVDPPVDPPLPPVDPPLPPVIPPGLVDVPEDEVLGEGPIFNDGPNPPGPGPGVLPFGDEGTDGDGSDEEPEEPAPPTEPEEEGDIVLAGALDRVSTTPGGDFTISGEGCGPGEEVDVFLDGELVTTITAGPDGTFTTDIGAAGDAAIGRHQVVAKCGDREIEIPIDVVLTNIQNQGNAAAAVPFITVMGIFLFFLLQGKDVLEGEGGEGRGAGRRRRFIRFRG